MARELYPGQLVEYPDGTNAINAPVTVWDDLVAGSNVTTQLTASDGVSGWTPATDAQGLLAAFRGPDGYEKPLYVDTGAGTRFAFYSSTVLSKMPARLAALEQAISALQAGGGGGGTGGTTTGSAGNMVAIFGAAQPRLNPVNGLALPAGTTVLWIADTEPTNIVKTTDIWYSGPAN